MENLKTFFNDAKAVKLTKKERTVMFDEIANFVKENPLSEGVNVSSTSPSVRKEILYRHIFRRTMIFTILAALIIAGSGGVVVAAEQSLPGQLLYPIKIAGVERVQEALVFDSKTGASLEADLAGKRLSEAEELAASGNLTAKDAAEINDNFSTHYERFGKFLTKLQNDNRLSEALEASSDLEDNLSAHKNVLAKMRIKEADKLEGNVVGKESALADVRIKTDALISAKSETGMKKAAAGRITAAENKISEVTNFIDKWQTRLGVSVVADAKARLVLASQKLSDAKTALAAGKASDAFTLAGDAQSLAQEAKLLLDLDDKQSSKSSTGSAKVQGKEEMEIKTSGEVKAEHDENGNKEHGQGNANVQGQTKVEEKIKLELPNLSNFKLF